MTFLQIPDWSTDWVYFADWLDLTFAVVGLVFAALLLIWWRQQTRYWFRIGVGAVLAALLLCIASFYLFEVPAHRASCPQGCLGWRGFPRPFATVAFDGSAEITMLDFALNWLMLWLVWLVASVVWCILGIAIEWPLRSGRIQLLFVLVVAFLPWALLPRLIDPPQPLTTGEDLRLATNARRAAEFTYRITGFWVQRLALEDVRHLPTPNPEASESTNVAGSQVCLRGYTYFYIPWRRYRIELDTNGVTALNLTQLPLSVPCWP
jgi:hypothetical protein